MRHGIGQLAAMAMLCLALVACGQQGTAPQQEEGAVPDASKERVVELPAEESEPVDKPDSATVDDPALAAGAATEQSPWLGTWTSDNGESLVVTAVSDEGISVTYNGWTASGNELFHSDYEMAFQDAEQLVCSAPTGQSWDYVLHLEGDQIRMESRYPDRFFYRESVLDGHDPFYGIWCYASKDVQDAQRAADGLRAQGFDALVFLSTDWEGLNPEPWFVVAAGAYRTEEEALRMLPAVQEMQADAYVKYSGAWIGE